MDSDNNLRFKSILSKWTDFCRLWDGVRGGAGWSCMEDGGGEGICPEKSEWDLRHRSILRCTCDQRGGGDGLRPNGAVRQRRQGWEIWKESRKERKSAEEEWLKGANGWRDVTAQAAQVAKKNNSHHSRAENALREAENKKQEGGTKCWRHNRSGRMDVSGKKCAVTPSRSVPNLPH